MLIVSETFDSIQGEGFYSGNRSFFVRLAGCDMGCHWCDEKKSWPNDNFPRLEINQLVKQFNQMRKMMKMMKKSGPSGMMSALGLKEK